MKPLRTALTTLFGLLAVAAHTGLALWGLVWPLWHLAAYPEDQSVNLFIAEASALFLAFSLGGIRHRWRSARWLPLFVAATLVLPCGICALLACLRVQFLDPALAYVTLLPGITGVLAPYGMLGLLAGPSRLPLGHERLRDAEVLQDAGDDCIHDVFNCLGAVVEGGSGG